MKGLKEINKDCKSAHRIPDDWKVSCYQCDWKGKLSECPSEEYQETWEMPKYQAPVCPECGEYIEI